MPTLAKTSRPRLFEVVLVDAEIYARKANGKPYPDGSDRRRLTANTEEDRAPGWSPDGSLIAYMCRLPTSAFVDLPPPAPGIPGRVEICVIKSDGTGTPRRLTRNKDFESVGSWLPPKGEGASRVHRLVSGRQIAPGQQRMFVLSFNDAVGEEHEELLRFDDVSVNPATPTDPATNYLFAKYGVLKGRCR